MEKMRRHSRPFLYFAYKRGTTDMKHYESSDWNFALDIPRRWNSFPPVPTNSPNEVIRFASREDGNHLLIIFRQPHDPKSKTIFLSAHRAASLPKTARIGENDDRWQNGWWARN